MYLLIISAALIFLALGSYVDLKTGEIPEKISYGFISSVLIISALDSIHQADIHFFLNSLLMGVAFFMVSFVFFYLGQWGGGDVKLMAGIGCSLGYLGHVNHLVEGLFPYYLTYFINMAFIALPYVIIYGLFLGVKNPRTRSEFRKYWGDTKTKAVLLLSILPSILAFYLNLRPMGTLYLLFPPLFISALYLKAVEMTALQRIVKVSELHEGDIIAEDLIVDNKKIICKKNIDGLSEEDIQSIQRLAVEGKISDEIKTKEGVRLVPVFFLTFISVLWVGNFMEMILVGLA